MRGGKPVTKAILAILDMSSLGSIFEKFVFEKLEKRTENLIRKQR